MLSGDQKRQVRIALASLGLALIMCLTSTYRMKFAVVFGVIEITASLCLLFGALKAHESHKPKFMLFWLGNSLIFFTVLLYCCVNYFTEYFRFYRIESYPSLIALTVAAAGVAYMMYIIYEMYVGLTVNDVAPTVDATVRVPDEEKTPPSYDASMNLVISTQS